MLVMQFSQKGIDELRKYQEHIEMCHPEGDFVLSDGFDEGALGRPKMVQLGLTVVVVAQRCLGSRTTFYGVMIAPRSSRRGCPHNTQGLPPGSTSSSTIVLLPWHASLAFFRFSRPY
jgi:hypothetical protein